MGFEVILQFLYLMIGFIFIFFIKLILIFIIGIGIIFFQGVLFIYNFLGKGFYKDKIFYLFYVKYILGFGRIIFGGISILVLCVQNLWFVLFQLLLLFFLVMLFLLEEIFKIFLILEVSLLEIGKGNFFLGNLMNLRILKFFIFRF